MKIKSDLCVICEYASVDNDGKLSVNGIFKEMYVNKMPAYFLRFYIVSTLTGESEQIFDVQITILGPDNKVVNHQEDTVQLGLGGVTHLITDVHNFPVEQTGEYTVKLSTNDNKTITKSTFKVIDMKASDKKVN